MVAWLCCVSRIRIVYVHSMLYYVTLVVTARVHTMHTYYAHPHAWLHRRTMRAVLETSRAQFAPASAPCAAAALRATCPGRKQPFWALKHLRVHTKAPYTSDL